MAGPSINKKDSQESDDAGFGGAAGGIDAVLYQARLAMVGVAFTMRRAGARPLIPA
jgi:hypothetical protein